MYEHLLRLSWSGTPSVVSHVPLHHDILFACYNTVDDDDDKDRDEDEDENVDEDDEDKDKDKDADGENCCFVSSTLASTKVASGLRFVSIKRQIESVMSLDFSL